jgi:hypothetical protein
LILGLWACPEDHRPAAEDVGAPPPPPSPITRTATIAPPPPTIPGKASCEGGPAWIELEPCTRDGAIWGVGSVEMMMESIGRSAAGHNALATIVTAAGLPTEGEISGLEVPRTKKCGSKIFALAKLPGPSATLPGCTIDPLADEQPGKCPAWIERVAYREGDQLIGVGLVEGIENKSLAEQAGRTRAQMSLSRMQGLKLRVEGKRVDVEAIGHKRGLGEVSTEIARCGDLTAVKMSVKAPR